MQQRGSMICVKGVMAELSYLRDKLLKETPNSE